MRKLACMVAVLMVSTAPAAMAAAQQTEPGPAAPTRSAPAQTMPAEEDTVTEDAPIVVQGQRPVGSVVGDIQPEETLSPADVRAYGVSSIGDLLTELGPQTGSGRGSGGPPVVLLNGHRISNFGEIRNIPTEAILRVDILPEEVALKYGYAANQRVVNIVLRPRFHSITGELTGTAPTQGGYGTAEAETGILRLNPNGRFNLDVDYQGNSRLLESQRNINSTTSQGLFDTTGNITSTVAGAQIDPALSALAGMPVTVAGVPASALAGAPTLADFVAGANDPNVTSLGRFRTLVSPKDQLTINAVVDRNLSQSISATLNGQLTVSDSDTLLGLPSATLTLPAGNPFSPFSADTTLLRYYDNLGAISQSNTNRAAHFGFTVNRTGRKWMWTVTGNYDYADSSTFTQNGIDPAPIQALLDAGDPAFNPFGPLPLSAVSVLPDNRANSQSNVGSLDAMLHGPLLHVPAGDLSATFRATGSASGFDSQSLRAGVTQDGHVDRQTGDGQVNLDLPLTSKREHFLDAIGDLSLNGNVEVQHLSDFGTLTTTGYGAHWSPIGALDVIVSVTDEEDAPSAQQLGNPTLVTPNVRVFDYVTNQTVAVTTVSGGNPGLAAERRHVFKLGLNLRPFEKTNFNLSANYITQTTRDDIASLPTPTAAIEAAFPDNFIRDADGDLIRVDTRPVNFSDVSQQQLRWGFNLSLPLKTRLAERFAQLRAQRQAAREAAQRNGTPMPAEGSARQGGQPGAQGGQASAGGDSSRRRFGGGGGRGFGGRGGPSGGRVQLSLYHTWYFRNDVLIRDGLPRIDLLDGGAIGSNGGQPQHQVQAQAGITRNGLGFRLTGEWQSATHVDAGPSGGDSLRFGALGTVNLRLFADMGQQIDLVRKHRWLRGTRLTLAFDNLFDTRMRVTDQTGATPINYQPDLLDPTGRTVRLSIRKLFF